MRRRIQPPVMIEFGLNLVAIVTLPLMFRLFGVQLVPVLDRLGFGGTATRLAGQGGFTDVGWEVVSARGLAEPGFSAYDPLRVLDQLIGMGWPADQANSHPPFGVVLGLPLAYLNYEWWISYWIVASIVAIAVSMRVMRVPAWVAYPLAIGISLTFAGRDGLQSTYPAVALALALAWAYQRNWWVSGIAFAVFGATRGVGLVLLAQPALKRRWRTVGLAVGITAALTSVAVVLEPDVFTGFLTGGRASIEVNLARGDLLTPASILAARGVPEVVVWGIAAAWVGFGLWLRRSVFWLLVWFTFAVTPIAWYHSPIAAIPLIVAMWYSGKLGRVLGMIVGVAFATTTQYMSVDWLVMVATSAVAVLACPLPDDPRDLLSWKPTIAHAAEPSSRG